MSNEGNFKRRTTITVIKDSLKCAEERVKESKYNEKPSWFWDCEATRLRWVLDQLKTRRLGNSNWPKQVDPLLQFLSRQYVQKS